MSTRRLLSCLAVSSLLPLLPAAVSAQGTTSNVTIGQLVDVPTRLGGIDYLPTQIVGIVPGGYALAFDAMAAGLPAGTRLDALAVLEGPSDPNVSALGGIIAFSVDTPVTVGTLTIGPADIVLFTGAGQAEIEVSGVAPEPANIDAVARIETGEWVVSFDAPVTVGPLTFLPADLALVSAAGLSPYLTGASLGLGPDTNVIGFEKNPGPAQSELYFTFDTPVTLGTSTFLPGQIVRYAGGTFSLYHSDPLFPAESALADFSLPPSPGEVPDGFTVPGVPLSVEAVAGGAIQLSWGASCIPSGTDYAVYEGVIGDWYSHAPRLCTTGGLTTATLTPGQMSRYYLVVPTNAMFEGSYGRRSSGTERPAGEGACHIQKLASPTCP